MPERSVPVSLVVVEPPAGVAVGVQSGKGGAGVTVMTQWTDGSDLRFDIDLPATEVDGGRFRFRGPFVQSDDKGQFVYLRWGRSAGDHLSPIERRTKVYLDKVSPGTVNQAVGEGRGVEIALQGKAKDGGPACATVAVSVR